MFGCACSHFEYAMASADPTSTAPKRSRNSTERKEATKTTASRRLWRCGLMSSQLIMLAPRSLIVAAIGGMGMIAMKSARNSTIKRRKSAEAMLVSRLCPPILYTSHMRLKDAHVGKEERKGSRQLEIASDRMPLRASVKPPILRFIRRIAATV